MMNHGSTPSATPSWHAERLSQLPPYLFVEIDRKKRAAIAAGRDIIDFGVGDPDLPTPQFILERMAEAIRDPANHRYPLGIGSLRFRETVAEYVGDRFGVTVDPGTEVVALIGTKEGLGHLPTAVLNPGDIALTPDPAYPVYEAATLFAGGKCHTMSLSDESDWLPNLEVIPMDVRRRARLMFLNYPNNPTSACATRDFFARVVDFVREHRILIVQDAAYADLHFGNPPLSILEIDGAKDCCIELHSLSKTFSMTGWRIGFAIGNANALSALAKVKSNMDSGPFGAIQDAAITALEGIDRPEIHAQRETYRRRRDVLITGLRELCWKVNTSEATFFVWTRCPDGIDFVAAAAKLLDDANIVAIPGIGFGPQGRNYLRFALTVPEPRIAEAVQRMRKLM
ncbi:MAG: LL-diaminopimelate aminotransferase [Planctomycetota bacterium]